MHKYIPKHLHPSLGERTPCQRWRKFLRNHAWDLITSGVAADLTRGRKAFRAEVVELIRRKPMAEDPTS